MEQIYNLIFAGAASDFDKVLCLCAFCVVMLFMSIVFNLLSQMR